jgi:hypothetical protein
MRFTAICVVLLALTVFAFAAPPPRCATIQGGTITDVNGNPLTTGYDQWGYNYQAMMFNGLYDNYSRPAVPATEGDSLMMKWNDAWLSNKDCNDDGKLDRHFGYASYKGSGAWLTNHMSGSYEVDGKTHKWTYFVKIVAVPLDAVNVGGTWYTSAGGIEIGPAIWGVFAIIQEIYNDTGTGDHGVLYKSPTSPGFGFYKP